MQNRNAVSTHIALKDQALAKNANTGYGQAIDLRKTDGDVALFLKNSGLSTSLSVTYQIGFFVEGNEPSSHTTDGAVNKGTITWATPPTVTGATTGAVTDMTTVDCHGSQCSARVVLPRAPFAKFLITENNDATANNVSLYVIHN